MAQSGLLRGQHDNVGLMPALDESENQPSQTMEQVLKKRREKMAFHKLGIQPDLENDG